MKKLRFLLLAVIVLATVVAFSLSANAAVIASGNCGENGDNVKYTLDDIGTLTISGTGKMENFPNNLGLIGSAGVLFEYLYDIDYFWDLQSQVKKVVIMPGVTHIGRFSFSDYNNIEEVVIPDSVIYVGDYAFSGTAIKSIILPKNIEYLGPQRTESEIPYKGTVTIDGVVFSANKKMIVRYPKDKVDEDGIYIVPEYVKGIASGAFSDAESLDEIILPEGLKYIAIGSFGNLEYLVVPSTVESLGDASVIGGNGRAPQYSSLAYINVKHLIVLSNEASAVHNETWGGFKCEAENVYCYRGSATDKVYQEAKVYEKYGYTVSTQIHYIDGHTHTYDGGVVLKQGSCTEEGLKVYTCTNCFINPGMKKYEVLSGGGHSYTSDITKSPTCTSTGTKKFTCSCGDTYTETIAKAEHTCDKWFVIVPAKAGADGRECGICNVCGAVAIRSIAALPKDRPVFRLTSSEAENGYAVTLSLENNVNGFYSLGVVVKYDAEKLTFASADTSNAVAKFEAANTSGSVFVNYVDTAYFANKGELCTIYFEPAEDIPTGSTEVAITTVISENPYTAVNCTIDLEKETAPETTTVIMTIGQAAGFVSGKAFALDAAPIIRNDRTMLPVRFVAEAFGAEVGWDGATSTATVKTEDTEIAITIGATTAIVNGEEVTLDSPAFIENSRTYLPVRFVAEKLGASVQWDGASSTATLTK